MNRDKARREAHRSKQMHCSAIWTNLNGTNRDSEAPEATNVCSWAAVVSGGEELDVDLLQMTVVRETWEGILEDALVSPQQVQAFEAAALAAAGTVASPSLTPANMGGEWKVFELCAQPVLEKDAVTGMRLIPLPVVCRPVLGCAQLHWGCVLCGAWSAGAKIV